MTIRVLVVDDQELIRGAVAAMLAIAEDLDVVGEAGDGAEALTFARALEPDVILMDIRMPVMDGLDALDAIAGDPDLAGVRVVMLTTFEDDANVLRAMRAGASGFMGKGAKPAELLAAVRTVAAGDALLSPRATRAVIAAATRPAREPAVDSPVFRYLTEREREVVLLVAQGLSNDEIATSLVVSPLTAKTHVNRAMQKVGARDRAQLVVAAYRAGLIPD